MAQKPPAAGAASCPLVPVVVESGCRFATPMYMPFHGPMRTIVKAAQCLPVRMTSSAHSARRRLRPSRSPSMGFTTAPSSAPRAYPPSAARVKRSGGGVTGRRARASPTLCTRSSLTLATSGWSAPLALSCESANARRRCANCSPVGSGRPWPAAASQAGGSGVGASMASAV